MGPTRKNKFFCFEIISNIRLYKSIDQLYVMAELNMN